MSKYILELEKLKGTDLYKAKGFNSLVFDELGISKLEKLEEDETVGYKDDKLFLLSKEEYEKYKEFIPGCKTCWWLRSPGINDKYAADVSGSGWVNVLGKYVNDDFVGIRPALKIDTSYYGVGKRIVYKKFPFTVVDEDLCIATVPIAFDKFDDKNNDYENSCVRKYLMDFVGEE